MTDPIIDELHRHREEALAEVGFDHHVFCERLRERERQSGRVVVPPSPVRPNREPLDAGESPPGRFRSRR